MKLHVMQTGVLDVNTYILYGKVEGECVIIDPSGARKITAFLESEGIKPTHILITHPHFDHIMAVAQLRETYDAKVCLYHAGAGMMEHPEGYAHLSVRGAQVDVPFKDGDILKAAGYSIRVMHTPGHEAAAVCYILYDERVIFSGDTLFRLGVGRSDLPGGDAKTLYDSIAYKLFTLDGDYTVYPGHERETTLEFERQHNPFMRRYHPKTW